MLIEWHDHHFLANRWTAMLEAKSRSTEKKKLIFRNFLYRHFLFVSLKVEFAQAEDGGFYVGNMRPIIPSSDAFFIKTVEKLEIILDNSLIGLGSTSPPPSTEKENTRILIRAIFFLRVSQKYERDRPKLIMNPPPPPHYSFVINDILRFQKKPLAALISANEPFR